MSQKGGISNNSWELHDQEKQKTEVEKSGGGLLPAVEGHSLGTRYKCGF